MCRPSKPAPASLSDGEAFVGTGERYGGVGFIQVNVYSGAFYLDKAKAAQSLEDYAGHCLEELCVNQDFYDSLLNGRFRKIVRLTFCRSLSKARIGARFQEALTCRVPPDQAATGIAFVDKLVPDSGFHDDDVLHIIFQENGSTVNVTLQRAGETVAQPLTELSSEPIWKGFLGMYFDSKSDLIDIKKGFITELPSIFAAGKLAPLPVDNVVSNCVPPTPTLDAFLETPSTWSTWKDFARRSNGRQGYRFGDVTRSLYHRATGKTLMNPEASPTDTIAQQSIQLQEIQDRHDSVKAALITAQARAEQVEDAIFFYVCLGCICGLLLAVLADMTIDHERLVYVHLSLVVTCIACATFLRFNRKTRIGTKHD